MSAHQKLPQEIWDEITSYLPPVSAFHAAEKYAFEPRAFDKVWSTIFKTDQWHESEGAEYANIVLIGIDLDSFCGKKTTSARPSLVLTAFDRAGDLQYESDLLTSSFRGTYTGPGTYHLTHTVLKIGYFDVPEIFGEEFHYLFTSDGHQLQTKYCYWNDPQKKIRTLKGQGIRGVGGPISTFDELGPAFRLTLHPPIPCNPPYFPTKVTSMPEQYMFYSSSGDPDFWKDRESDVEPIYGHRFVFEDERYGANPEGGSLFA